jgi:hypothetical protein
MIFHDNFLETSRPSLAKKAQHMLLTMKMITATKKKMKKLVIQAGLLFLENV